MWLNFNSKFVSGTQSLFWGLPHSNSSGSTCYEHCTRWQRCPLRYKAYQFGNTENKIASVMSECKPEFFDCLDLLDAALLHQLRILASPNGQLIGVRYNFFGHKYRTYNRFIQFPSMEIFSTG